MCLVQSHFVLHYMWSGYFLPLQTHCNCCYKITSILHDSNTVPITYLIISISRYYFLLSLTHIFTFSHSGLTCPHAISYFTLHVDCPIMNKGTVVAEYYFILLDTTMVPITYYKILNSFKLKPSAKCAKIIL